MKRFFVGIITSLVILSACKKKHSSSDPPVTSTMTPEVTFYGSFVAWNEYMIPLSSSGTPNYLKSCVRVFLTANPSTEHSTGYPITPPGFAIMNSDSLYYNAAALEKNLSNEIFNPLNWNIGPSASTSSFSTQSNFLFPIFISNSYFNDTVSKSVGLNMTIGNIGNATSVIVGISDSLSFIVTKEATINGATATVNIPPNEISFLSNVNNGYYYLVLSTKNYKVINSKNYLFANSIIERKTGLTIVN